MLSNSSLLIFFSLTVVVLPKQSYICMPWRMLNAILLISKDLFTRQFFSLCISCEYICFLINVWWCKFKISFIAYRIVYVHGCNLIHDNYRLLLWYHWSVSIYLVNLERRMNTHAHTHIYFLWIKKQTNCIASFFFQVWIGIVLFGTTN